MLTTIILTAASTLLWGLFGYQVGALFAAIAARRAQLRKRK